MPFQAAPGIAGVTVEGRVDNQLTINDLYFFAAGPITGTNLGLLAGEIGTWVDERLSPILSDDWSAARVRAVDLGSPTGAQAEVAITVAGGVAGEAAPNNVAACVSFRTAQRGRSGRGRNFVPGIPNEDITLNTLSGDIITDLITAYSFLIGAGTFAVGWQWVVLSRQTEGALRAEGIGIPITSVVMVGTSVRSMRSREIGHGA